MAVALADMQLQQCSPVIGSCKVDAIGILVVDECPLFQAGLRSVLTQQKDCRLVGEATHPEDVLSLAREHRPIVLLDGGLTSTDPLDLVQQLRQVGAQGIMVFAPETGDEETLFQFLLGGAMAYEDRCISGDELLAKIRRVSLGEYLITGDALVAQAARRERLARIRRDALRAARFADASPPSPLVGGCKLVGDCKLSEQERATLEQVARGGTNAQVAQALGINHHTVKNHLDKIYRKLQVPDRTSAVVMALRKRWIVL